MNMPTHIGDGRAEPTGPATPAYYDEQLDEFAPAAGDHAAIDLRALWSAIWRNRWLIAAILIAALLAGVTATLLTAPTYSARATVQVDQRTARVLGTEDQDASGSLADADRFLQTQVDILHSRTLATKVADSLALYRDPAFLTSIGSPTYKPETTEAEKRRGIVDTLQNGVDINLPRNSRVIGISYASRDRNVASKVANAFATYYIETNLQRKFDQSAYARSFLERQLAQAKSRLEQSEIALIAYARSARLIDASAGAAGNSQETGPRSLTTANLVQLNGAYASAQAARLQAQQRWEQVQSTPLMSLPEVLSNPAIQQLSQKRAELQADYEQERQRHKADYPTVQQASAGLAEINRQINAIATGIRSTIRDAYLVATRQEQAIGSNVDQLKAQTLSEQDRSVRYNILRRETDTNRQLYDALLQRYKEVSAESGATNNNIAIIDRAEPPTRPIRPRPSLNMALALLGGLALAMLIVFVRERFDDAIRAPGDVEDKLGLPLLASIPLIKGRTALGEELSDPRSAVSEAYYALRAAIDLSSAGAGTRILLMTSSRQGEGKSTTALALSRIAAAGGSRVLLIDADLRKPSLHRSLAVDNKRGLSNVLAGHRRADEVIRASDVPGLDFISSGPQPPSPAQLLMGQTLPEFLQSLEGRYDLVIIDAPPVLGLADAPRLASVADVTVFAVEADMAHRGGAKAALRRLQSGHANVVGAVLTKFDAKRAGYGYYESYYGYGYDKPADEE